RSMRDRGRGGDGGRDWGSIDWSNIDLSGFGSGRNRISGPSRRFVFLAIVVFLLLLIPLFVGPLVSFLTDLLWFRSLGLEDVYLRRYTASFWAFLAFFLLFFVIALPNLYLVLRPQVPRVVVDPQRSRPSALATTLRTMPLLLIPAFFFGLAGSGQWDELLRYVNAIPFGVTDPVFGKDVGFYFFTLPVLDFLRDWAITAVITIAIGVVLVYALRGLVGVATDTVARADLAVAGRTALALARPARAHLSVLGGIFLALIALGYVLDQYELLFRQESVLTGAGYTSINARLPALTILSVIVAIAALACFANAFARTLWVLGGAIAVWFVASILVLGIYPGIIQNFIVNPDQLNRERPYLERNIEATRAAYRLDNVEESLFNVGDTPTVTDARAEFSDTATVRLWDYRPLLSAFDTLQALRQYYTFNDVDVDRYQIAGRELPVMLSARELSSSRLPQATWVNRHLVFTHGYGAVLTAVGGVAAEGRPELLVKDIPVQGEPRVDQPRIYYGDSTDDYVIVDSLQDEFDYAQEGGDARTRFTGGGGVGIGGLWDRFLFALRFGDSNLLFTNQVAEKSRVLFHRDIQERERLIAPFLSYDPDPYLVIADGKLFWINDAYTTGDRYPYSERYAALQAGSTTIARGSFNYIRNSVKVVQNAYDGSIQYYVVDDTDPVVRNLRAIYPTLFKSINEMPQSLRTHIRYPEAIFSVQTQVFSLYHMTNAEEFYNRVDAWRIANELQFQGSQKQPVEPYYVTTKLPGSDRREFILFVPMTPAGGERDNMVAWIAGRADAPEYGKLRVLRFPKDRTIFGPLQVEGRIDNDATIRQQLTLLCPSSGGTTCIRGNLLVLPVGSSFIYVKPLFIQATQGKIPELQRLILATQDKVVMADTFAKALDALFTGTTPVPTPNPTPTPTPAPGASATPRPSGSPTPTPSAGASQSVNQLIKQASDHYDQAQDALRRGDFTEYGRLIALLQDDLAKLRAATGQ
ncbi:MAG TPA: UPF0182 family protein, partial [Candidatus Limnocylindrales bacterium]|nr:UPF0182 family protein [Candidatus Limnocylindrales bacterium]